MPPMTMIIPQPQLRVDSPPYAYASSWCNLSCDTRGSASESTHRPDSDTSYEACVSPIETTGAACMYSYFRKMFGLCASDAVAGPVRLRQINDQSLRPSIFETLHLPAGRHDHVPSSSYACLENRRAHLKASAGDVTRACRAGRERHFSAWTIWNGTEFDNKLFHRAIAIRQLANGRETISRTALRQPRFQRIGGEGPSQTRTKPTSDASSMSTDAVCCRSCSLTLCRQRTPSRETPAPHHSSRRPPRADLKNQRSDSTPDASELTNIIHANSPSIHARRWQLLGPPPLQPPHARLVFRPPSALAMPLRRRLLGVDNVPVASASRGPGAVVRALRGQMQRHPLLGHELDGLYSMLRGRPWVSRLWRLERRVVRGTVSDCGDLGRDAGQIHALAECGGFTYAQEQMASLAQTDQGHERVSDERLLTEYEKIAVNQLYDGRS